MIPLAVFTDRSERHILAAFRGLGCIGFGGGGVVAYCRVFAMVGLFFACGLGLCRRGFVYGVKW